jgi:UDP-N-acetylmuramoyl-tripeptide--D-alanyl-D-alanine ligase
MNTVEEIYRIFLEHPRISTDSRNIVPDSVFFALKGEHFDGNRFAAEALEKGAAYCVIDGLSAPDIYRCLPVPDTLLALQQMASIHRSHIHAEIIGITGSNGKTTTKELIGSVLSSSYKTVVTRENLNNHIGVPLTVLAIEKETAFAVVEMGANHPGEIARLCAIARPAYGIITNIGKAHLEGFGSFEGVVKAKSELYDFLRLNKGLAFVNADDDLLMGLSSGMSTLTYGSAKNAGCMGSVTASEPFLSVSWNARGEKGIVHSNLFGDYNFGNIMAAVSIGSYFGVNPDKVSQAIDNYFPDNNRSQIARTGQNTLVLDAYNANPSSMKAALSNFQRFGSGPKMVILGDMMELGDFSADEHSQVITLARQLSFQKIFLVGELFSRAAGGGPEICFPGIREAEEWFRQHPVKDMTVLLKGSRKMQLENLRPLF